MALNIWICGILEHSGFIFKDLRCAPDEFFPSGECPNVCKLIKVWDEQHWSGNVWTKVRIWKRESLIMNARKVFVCSCQDFRALMSRLSCVYVQIIVCSWVFPNRIILNAPRPPCAFILVWTYLASVCESLPLFSPGRGIGMKSPHEKSN